MTKTQSIITRDGRLHVRFTLRGDRFHHAIACRQSTGEMFSLLASVEGTPDTSWPDSPPFQQVEAHELATGTSLLAVGLAGTSHWSASIEQVETLPEDLKLPAGESRVRFDVACRIRAADARLGTTYDIAEGISAEKSQRGLVFSSSSEVSARLETECEISCSGRSLVISPGEIPDERPTTVRWTYDLVIAGPNIDK